MKDYPGINVYSLEEKIKRLKKAFAKIESCISELDEEMDILNCSPNADGAGFYYYAVKEDFSDIQFMFEKWFSELNYEVQIENEIFAEVQDCTAILFANELEAVIA